MIRTSSRLEPDAKGNLVNVLSFPKGVETYGTVSAIDNGWVSFDVGEAFKGDLGATVVLNAELLMAGPEGGAVTSVSEVLITAVGERFLVSGSDGYAGVCNQTQAYDAAQADAWRTQLQG